MIRRFRSSAVLAVALVIALASAALAVVTYGARSAIPGDYGYNYSNSLDYTGTPGTTGFRLHNAWVNDWTAPAKATYVRSANGTTWTTPKSLSGTNNAEGTSLATAGSTVIVGWMTGYSYYDADGAPRRVQVRVSKDAGATWGAITSLSSATGSVDYPIVAAGVVGTTQNVYATWIDSKTGAVKFRQSSNGGGTWSAPINLGSTTAHASGAAYGYSGFPSIGATGDRISVAWIADDTGTLKVRSIDANGVAAAPATAGNWKAPTTLADKISMTQQGFPIVGASPLSDTIAISYNTNTAQRYTTFTGGASANASKLIWTNGVLGPVTMAGGYSTAVEPAPGGGFVAIWAGCRAVGLANPCNYGSTKAKFDLVESSSADGTAWSAPQRIEVSGSPAQLNDEASIVVIPNAAGVKVFAQFNAYNSRYSYYDVWMKIGTGSLG